MSDETDRPEDAPAKKRGEAAWKETKDRVAERNEKARKAGRQRREIYERARAMERRDAERKQMAQLAKLKSS